MYFQSYNMEECCGCKACGAVCPVHAIKFENNDEGFWYPVIDRDLCIRCGKCERICTFSRIGRHPIPEDVPTFALTAKNHDVLMRSASGGAFTLLSDVILSHGGIVYGHVYDAEMHCHCEKAETPQERDKFCGSKYVQSDMGSSYQEIKKEIVSGREVLVTGTPCQIAAVKSFLGTNINDKIFFLDLVCHGTPSPGVFQAYMKMLGEKEGSKVVDVVFRGKHQGWKSPTILFRYADGKQSAYPLQRDRYNWWFQGTDCILRPSCFICPFPGSERVGDITIADFWGVEETHPDLFDSNGVSLILANNEKGKSLLGEVTTKAKVEAVQFSDATKRNYPLLRPSRPYIRRADFFQVFKRKGVRECCRRFHPDNRYLSLVKRLRRKILRIIGV